MKRFDFDFNFDDFIYRFGNLMAVLAVTGMVVLLWGCIIGIVVNLFAGPAEAAAPENPAPVVQEIEPEATVVVEAEPAPGPIEIDQELKEQLAVVIYREAGGDNICDDCRFRVADVALNRVADDRFPDTLSGVLTQKSQYGTMYWDGIVWPDRADNPGEAHAVERAYNTAEEVLRGNHSELYGEGYIFQSEFPKLGEQPVECCGIYYAKG